MNMRMDWSPFLSMPLLWLMIACAVAAFVVARWRRLPDAWWRGALFLVLLALVMNPRMMNEVRQGLPDKLVIVVDDSDSQKIAGRDKTAEKVLQHIQDSLKNMRDIEPVIIRSSAYQGEGTNLFGALRDNIAAIPMPQVAGTVFITDGQVHDVPDDLALYERLGPLHTVLTGRPDEYDRKVTIVSAPKYGLLNQMVQVTVRIDQSGSKADTILPLALMQDGAKVADYFMMPGQDQIVDLTLKHPGQNVFEFVLEPGDGEMTDVNNTAPIIINGVRDRLKVLLVTGAPNMGERAWRNLLKSDPGIDLVHFTILRSPSSQDVTPTRELSLIVFPVEELFVQKIADFDLIIFDKYMQHGLMMPYYFKNIENYIRNGGAFLMAMGTDRLDDSIFKTALADALPVTPRSEEISSGAYVPQLTAKGMRHPVTADLQQSKNWGKWYRQAQVEALRGDILLEGADNNPLLVIDKVGEGRVAVLSSDNIWLWGKGGASAGPYTELLRNTAHWLMKEPELEDGYIKAEVRLDIITVSKRDIGEEEKTVLMRKPSGEEETIQLAQKDSGWVRAQVEAKQHGVYSFSAGDKKAFVVVGTAMNPEYADVLTTADKMKPVAEKTGGGIVWAGDGTDFRLRQISAAASQKSGKGWLGLRQNQAYAVDQVESRDVFSNWLFLLIIIGFTLFVWRREGRSG